MKLVIKNLAFAYPGGKNLWQDVNFSISSGEIFPIMGANGCGKSTLIRCLIGFLKPSQGSIALTDTTGIIYTPEKNMQEFTKKIAYVPQMQNTAYAFTVRDYVVMGRAPHLGAFQKPSKVDYELTDTVLQEMRIYELKDRVFNTLSGGQQRQAVIARAIVQETELIIMDEPVNHLDYGNQYRVIDMIEKLAERKIAVVLTTHAPDHALYFNKRVGVILHENFLVGEAQNLITEELLHDLYHVKIKIFDVPEFKRRVCLAQKEG